LKITKRDFKILGLPVSDAVVKQILEISDPFNAERASGGGGSRIGIVPGNELEFVRSNPTFVEALKVTTRKVCDDLG
jgi:hypothetical protein